MTTRRRFVWVALVALSLVAATYLVSQVRSRDPAGAATGYPDAMATVDGEAVRFDADAGQAWVMAVLLAPFVEAGKAVFGVEYVGIRRVFCPPARAAQFSWLKKRLDLGAWVRAC